MIQSRKVVCRLGNFEELWSAHVQGAWFAADVVQGRHMKASTVSRAPDSTHISPELLQLAIILGLESTSALESPNLALALPPQRATHAEALSRIQGKVASKVVNVDRLSVSPRL